MKPGYLALLFSCLFPLAGHAELNVIADLGGDDASSFFEGVNKQPGMAESSPVSPPVRQGLDAMLPVNTPEMTPGNIGDRRLNLPGIGALFLVGSDELSKHWLEANADRLRAKHAAGMIVNVSSKEEVQMMREIVPGVALAPASGSELSRRLKLEHYPVLITDNGLSQQVSP
ncbi:integrating conjugative element protein [Erwinia amylovora]|uniref:integrating conjugative element protein n=1 Tax=Erwinia amylovora TaxID=552 RepID=UPI000C06F906|nr:integrating conjugative element protein [Erwinia amylovora]